MTDFLNVGTGLRQTSPESISNMRSKDFFVFDFEFE